MTPTIHRFEPRRLGARRTAALLAAALCAGPVAAAEPDPAASRAIMREVFAALRVALPPSLDDERFADPALRPEILAALGTLARHAERLERHGAGADDGFGFLSRSLARDAREVESRYARGRFLEARFLVHGLVETCAACHARLPDPDDARLAERFLDEEAIAALPVPERARLAMATRQFERALATQEAILAAPEFDVGSIDLLGYLEDYLEICLRVKNDAVRPTRTLETFAAREGVGPELRRALRQWVDDLRALVAGPPVEGLVAGRTLVERAEAAALEDGERSQLVRYQAASGALLRHVAALPAGDPDAAEAYYWLGLIESRVGRSMWLSQTEPYLEAAIRLAPASPTAERAWALLEEYVVLDYTGSSGEHVPPDVQRWLDELGALIDTAQREAAPATPLEAEPATPREAEPAGPRGAQPEAESLRM